MMFILLSTTVVIDNARHRFVAIMTKKLFLIQICHLQTFPLLKLPVKFRFDETNFIFYPSYQEEIFKKILRFHNVSKNLC